MHLYAELWNVRPEWSALGHAERTSYVASIGPGMEALLAQGVELVGFAVNDEDTPLRSPHQYLALWRMADAAQAAALEATVEAAGWHHFFDQVNARGEVLAPPDALAHMVALPRSDTVAPA